MYTDFWVSRFLISDKLETWKHAMANFRVSPRAVCRTILTTLDEYKPLTAREEGQLIYAIENSGVENGVSRMLASLTKNTLKELLKSI